MRHRFTAVTSLYAFLAAIAAPPILADGFGVRADRWLQWRVNRVRRAHEARIGSGKIGGSHWRPRWALMRTLAKQ